MHSDPLPFEGDAPDAHKLIYEVYENTFISSMAWKVGGSTNHIAVACWRTLCREKEEEEKARNALLGPGNGAIRTLDLFPIQIVDVVYEVLSHLHPLDLSHVARANKFFRGLLLSPHANSIWRAAFDIDVVEDQNTFSIPTCPYHIPGRRWAKLLFGADICEFCDASDTRPDYTIYRRLCTSCMNQELSPGVPGYDSFHSVQALVPQSYRHDGRQIRPNSALGRMWPGDGADFARKYTYLAEQSPSSEGSFSDSEASTPLQMFVVRSKKILRETEDRALEAMDWAENITDNVFWDAQIRAHAVTKRAIKRLIEEGHNAQDVSLAAENRFSESVHLMHFPRLTSRRWHKIRPYLLPLVESHREARLLQQRLDLIQRRKVTFLAAVAQVLSNAPHQTWVYNPPSYTLETMAGVSELLNDPSDGELAPNDLRISDILSVLGQFVANWRHEKKRLLASLLPRSEENPDIQRLDLVTSVFTCLGSWSDWSLNTSGRSLIGWAGAGSHLQCRSLEVYWDRRLHYCSEGASAAVELMRLVGLDPATTTVDQMDMVCGTGRLCGNEKRFICMLCPAVSCKGGVGRPVMHWRECVAHVIKQVRDSNNEAHRSPSWGLLSEEAAAHIRRFETLDPYVLNDAWFCALCPAHYDNYRPRAEVLQHVRDQYVMTRCARSSLEIHF
ncbi:unnamed protein product [Mycena citricolor]|uniref:F-box domain-containing protein n=1 Tax=Mycena citricolor TaxID=2018698 RepID=A0AAD2HR47_9AGAR|nr:unnamed protein product [Mycena citricolor]